jgi:hypothetical protein
MLLVGQNTFCPRQHLNNPNTARDCKLNCSAASTFLAQIALLQIKKHDCCCKLGLWGKYYGGNTQKCHCRRYK